MHTQTRKTTETFAHPVKLDGFEAVRPAGIYSVESDNDVLDGMFLPDCLRQSVLIHLHSTPGSPAHAQTVTVPWTILEAALLLDRSPATMAPPPEPGLEGMLLAPTARQFLRADGVSEPHIRELVSHLPERNHSHA